MANITINKVIRPSTPWEKIFATYITELGPVCQYISNLKIEGKEEGGEERRKTGRRWERAI